MEFLITVAPILAAIWGRWPLKGWNRVWSAVEQ